MLLFLFFTFCVVSKIFFNIKLTEGLIFARDSDKKVFGTICESCRPIAGGYDVTQVIVMVMVVVMVM